MQQGDAARPATAPGPRRPPAAAGARPGPRRPRTRGARPRGRPSAWSRAVPENRTRPPQSGRTAHAAASATGRGRRQAQPGVPLGGTRGATGVHRRSWYAQVAPPAIVTRDGGRRADTGADVRGGRRGVRQAAPLFSARALRRRRRSGQPDLRPPPHPDDRLWRHPSEMRAHPIVPIARRSESPGAAATTPVATAAAPPAVGRLRRRGHGRGGARRGRRGRARGRRAGGRAARRRAGGARPDRPPRWAGRRRPATGP